MTDEDPLAPARGVCCAILLGTAVWVAVVLVIAWWMGWLA